MEDDWREQGQIEYLFKESFRKKKYKRYDDEWDHDHCEFCWAKFCEPDITEAADEECLSCGYATKDNYRWVCETCFRDFREKYQFNLLDPVLD